MTDAQPTHAADGAIPGARREQWPRGLTARKEQNQELTPGTEKLEFQQSRLSIHPHFTPSLFPSRKSPPLRREDSVDSRTISEPGEQTAEGW